MKTFLNVLYRRILYRIPLKFLLVLLAVCAVFIACFSSADQTIPSSNFLANKYDLWVQWYESVYRNYAKYDVSSMSSSTKVILRDWYSMVCFRRTNWTSCQYSFDNSTWYNVAENSLTCRNWQWDFYMKSCSSSNLFPYFFEVWDWLLPNYTSMQCQTEYNLIPISSVDSNYCTTNNLCPTCQICPVCPVGSWWVSSVYINDILHVGSPFIYMNIPEEIDWGYAYTQWWTNMNIDVVWYNQDNEKIEWIITIQNYKPDRYDFTNLVSNVIPLFVPWLCIILLLYFIFRFIKKVF